MMYRNITLIKKFFLVSLTFSIGFLICFIHQKFFYTNYIHGDAAVMKTLARAIIDSHSLLPKDFYYGNQIIFLRSSTFIALAMMLGFNGFNAFVVGSCLSAGLWFSLVYYSLKKVLKLKATSLACVLSVFIPFGYNDNDFMLGQQSHLAIASLTLICTIFTYLYIKGCRNIDLLVVFFTCLLITSESPIRGAMISFPILTSTLLIYKNKESFKIVVCSLFSLLCGAIVNHFLLKHTGRLQVDLSESMKILSLDSDISNIINISLSLIKTSTSVNLYSGLPVVSIAFVFYSFIILAIVLSCIFFARSLKELYALSLQKFSISTLSECDFKIFISSAAALALIVNIVATAFFNPDSPRHIIPAVAIFEVAFTLTALNVLGKLTLRKKTLPEILLVMFYLCNSFWVAFSLNTNLVYPNITFLPKNKFIITPVESAIRDTGIVNLYGTNFWRIMPLGLLSNDIITGEISPSGNKFFARHWLSRKSAFCQKKDVLYVLFNDSQDDRKLEGQLSKRGGILLYEGPSMKIYKSQPVWETETNCK
ncbi:hypothetical protein OW944_19240 [Klebsiella pneumoniae]|uniref:hypothetical protein n=1 Tax=Enterobacterales TaxID=91347 RepID=UPI0013C3706F|nr:MULTISPECIES: hypothetical protein [Enterobacterales]MDN2605043.1 hypothetical protein [Klebsiella variicola]MCS5749516.1 hypothetical protein [Klebsiella quasipneumoniae subsp. quasipneumoniae]MCX9857976.1 hypothetical protein [Klebsiella pneumoniae]MCX9868288.1 hypothetical protein [Klebsiella pneumoniae]MCY0498088.1 hypothetical protein [Klebsiella pneumoniae]